MSTLLNSGITAVESTAPPASPVVDLNRPWPGLFPFREEQQNYFFGRENEVRDLLDCVKRETVTLLFSKSGLGKSSVLQAGLFPELRRCGFLPVYIRIKYSDLGEPLVNQLKSAIQDAISNSRLDDSRLPTNDEPIWEYLHRRGGNVIGPGGRALCPVLVLDQFEEVFTLGRASEEVRQLSDEFLEDFARLAENSIPDKLRGQLADAPKLGEMYDFSGPGCRIVVSLREDFLPKLERLRHLMPSLVFTNSRMRLTEMNGNQALLAVSRPNPDLVTDEVAEHIVRFVAGDTSAVDHNLEALEVPPAMLSLFCRELSVKRGAALQITEELVSGNALTIIDDFYHRCTDNKPLPLRKIIEEKLVTRWGYRDNVDLTQARDELERQGVSPSLIDDLINERLLRVEEYRRIPRIELTHDVLVQPVIRSRDKRLQEEALARVCEQQREASKLRWRTTLSVAGTIAIALLAIFLSIAIYQRSLAVRQSALAQSEKRNAEIKTEEAKNEKAKADASAKEATRSAELARINAQDAIAAGGRAQRNSREIAKLGAEFMGLCDAISQQFARITEALEERNSTGEVSKAASVLRELYEADASKCADTAKRLNEIAPSNPQVAMFLTAVYPELAESAIKRGDKKAANQHSNEAIQMAALLQSGPSHFKSQLLAAYALCRTGRNQEEIGNVAAIQTSNRGIELLSNARKAWGTGQFDPNDWHAVASSYWYHATTLRKLGNNGGADEFYQQSFLAESNAIAAKPRLKYVNFAALVAREAGDEQQKLSHVEEARSWYDKVYRMKTQQITLLSEKSEATPEQKNTISVELAQAHGELAWYELLIGMPEDALKHARTGLSLAPNEKWIRVNEAHALLFTGQLADAEQSYLQSKDVIIGDRKLLDDIKADFLQLCEMGAARAEMVNIAHHLGIDDPKLNSCLAAAVSRK